MVRVNCTDLQKQDAVNIFVDAILLFWTVEGEARRLSVPCLQELQRVIGTLNEGMDYGRRFILIASLFLLSQDVDATFDGIRETEYNSAS